MLRMQHACTHTLAYDRASTFDFAHLPGLWPKRKVTKQNKTKQTQIEEEGK